MDERFKKSRLRGRVESSEGFVVRAASRTSISYADARGSIDIDGEGLAGKPTGYMILASSIPDDGTWVRADVLANVERAFEFAGWRLDIVR